MFVYRAHPTAVSVSNYHSLFVLCQLVSLRASLQAVTPLFFLFSAAVLKADTDQKLNSMEEQLKSQERELVGLSCRLALTVPPCLSHCVCVCLSLSSGLLFSVSLPACDVFFATPFVSALIGCEAEHD